MSRLTILNFKLISKIYPENIRAGELCSRKKLSRIKKLKTVKTL